MTTMNERMASLRDKARHAVNNAIRSGHISRPSACERCLKRPGLAKDGRSLIQAHHHDYAKPLEIEWICHQCHTDETTLERGTQCGHAKLTASDAVRIRDMASRGVFTGKIAEKFGLNRSTIQNIVNRKNWTKAEETMLSQRGEVE